MGVNGLPITVPSPTCDISFSAFDPTVDNRDVSVHDHISAPSRASAGIDLSECAESASRIPDKSVAENFYLSGFSNFERKPLDFSQLPPWPSLADTSAVSSVALHEPHCPFSLSPFYSNLLEKTLLLVQFIHEALNALNLSSSFLDFPIFSLPASALSKKLSSMLSEIAFSSQTSAIAASAFDVVANPDNECFSPSNLPQTLCDLSSFTTDSSTSDSSVRCLQESDPSTAHQALLCIASCLYTQLRRTLWLLVGRECPPSEPNEGHVQEVRTTSPVGVDDDVTSLLSSWSEFFHKLQNLRLPSQPTAQPGQQLAVVDAHCLCGMTPKAAVLKLTSTHTLRPNHKAAQTESPKSALSGLLTPEALPAFTSTPRIRPLSSQLTNFELSEALLDRPGTPYSQSCAFFAKTYSQSEPSLVLSSHAPGLLQVLHSLDAFSEKLTRYAGVAQTIHPFPLSTLSDQLSKLRLWLVRTGCQQSLVAKTGASHSLPKTMATQTSVHGSSSASFELSPTELHLRKLLNVRDTEVLYLLTNLPGGERLIDHGSSPSVVLSPSYHEAQLRLLSHWDLVQPIDPTCIPVRRVILPEASEIPPTAAAMNGHHSQTSTTEVVLPLSPSPTNVLSEIPTEPALPGAETGQASHDAESVNTAKALLRRCYKLIKHLALTLRQTLSSRLPREYTDELLDMCLRLNKLSNGEDVSSEFGDVHILWDGNFQKIPDSPGFARKWSRAPVQELAWAIDALEDIVELRSLTHFLTQQYNVVGTELEQQLIVNSGLRNSLREANNRLARIILGISQGNQRLAVMAERLSMEAEKHEAVNTSCQGVVDDSPTSPEPTLVPGGGGREAHQAETTECGPTSSPEAQSGETTDKADHSRRPSTLMRHLREVMKRPISRK
ncbi:unnamed protein product [Mesocestoides corti]|nr:unnamed protein product [Mesocestoides corti]